MRFRQRLCEYAIKHSVTRAAMRYHTNRQFIYRQLEKYNGDVRSLALQSRKPLNRPNAHTKEELALIRRMLKRNGVYGLVLLFISLIYSLVIFTKAILYRDYNKYEYFISDLRQIKIFYTGKSPIQRNCRCINSFRRFSKRSTYKNIRK